MVKYEKLGKKVSKKIWKNQEKEYGESKENIQKASKKQTEWYKPSTFTASRVTIL